MEDRVSYCATHNTYPAEGEPCWQCANPFIDKAMSQWVSVDDSLPQPFVRVLVCYDDTFTREENLMDVMCLHAVVVPIWLEADGIRRVNTNHLKVHHWMPLPEPPK